MISTKSKFTQEKIEMLKAKIANNPALSEVGTGVQNAGGVGGSSKGTETRTPFNVHAEMYALLKAIGEPGSEGSAYGPSSSSWLENIGYHVQQTVSRFVVAMNAAAAQRCAKVKAATFVLVTPAPLQGRPVRPLDPLGPELLALLRQVNARFMWLDPAGGADVTHKAQMEVAVAAAATSVGEGQPVAVLESDLAEVQLTLALSSHWRLDGAHADCMAPQPGLILPLLPVAWLPVADVFRSKAVLETIVRRIVAQGPPDPFGPLCPGFNLVAFPGYVTQFTSKKWIYQVWSETTTLTTASYLRGIIANRCLKLPPLRVRAEPHKAAAAAKAAPAVAIKGAWQKRGGGQNPHARPPMAPPAAVPGAGLRPGAHGSLAGRSGPLTGSAQINISGGPNGRQTLKVSGVGLKPPGSTPSGRLPVGGGGTAGPGGSSRPQKGQNKVNKLPARPTVPDSVTTGAAASNYTLGRAAGKRIAQALEQGVLTGTGPAGSVGKPGIDSQGCAGGASGSGAAGAGGGGGSRWVWPPLSASELAAQAAREGGMVAVDDQLDVGELLRQAEEQMHEFISGELKAAIRRNEKHVRRAQQQEPAAEGQRCVNGTVQIERDGGRHPQQQQEPGLRMEVVGGVSKLQDADGRSAKRQRVAPLESLQPALCNARSRLRSKLLVAPAKLSRHEERVPGWQPPLELILERARERTKTVVDSLLRASERAVSVAMRGIRKQAVERRARLRGGNGAAEAGEQCGEVDPDVSPGVMTGGVGGSREEGGRRRTSGGRGGGVQMAADDEGDPDQDGVYAAAIDQVFALLQEAWAGDMMGVLRERGVIRGRPRLQLCALLYIASRFIHAVEMLGYRRRSPRALVDLLREQLDWAVPLLCHVDGEPTMATFVSERLKPAWANTWAATLLDLLAVSYAGEDREGNNEMEFVARWDSDEDWEAGMEEAGGVEAATDALEELQRIAAAAAVAQQQGSQLDISELRASGRATSVSNGKQGTGRMASASGGGGGGRAIRPASGSARLGVGSSAAGGGTGPAAGGGGSNTVAAAGNVGKTGGSQPQVMEVDSLRGVVVAGSQRPVAGGRMAKHVARLDPVRPAHMMPAIIARPIIQVAPDPPPERLAALREEHRRKQRCGGAAANLAGLFDKEAAAPSPAAAAGAAVPVAEKNGRKTAAVAVPPAPPFAMHAPADKGAGRAAIFGGDVAAGQAVGSPGGAAACSESSTEVGPTPMDDGGGRHRSRLPGLDGGAAGGGVGESGTFGLARGLFTDMEAGEAPTVKFNPGGEGVFSQVATFQIVSKPREAAQQKQPHAGGDVAAGLHPHLAAAAEAGVAQVQHPAAEAAAPAPAAMFILGAAVAAPATSMDCIMNGRRSCLAPGSIPDTSDPPGLNDAADGADGAGRGVLCLPGGEADPLSELNFDGTVATGDAADANAEVVYDADGGELVCDDEEHEVVPSGCRLQGESHSADSLPCRRRHGDGDDSDSDDDSDGAGKTSPGAGKRAPREPVPDACSPCGFAVARRTAAAAAATSRFAGGNSRIPMCAPCPSLVPPRSRKAPPAAAAAAATAAAAAAGVASKRNSFRPAVTKPLPPRLSEAVKAQRAALLGAGRDAPCPQPSPALRQTIADGGESLNLLSATQAAAECPASESDHAQQLQLQQADQRRPDDGQGPAAEDAMDIDVDEPAPALTSPLPLQAPRAPDEVAALATDASAIAAGGAIATIVAHASPVKAGNQDVDVATRTIFAPGNLMMPSQASLECGLTTVLADDHERVDAEPEGTSFAKGTILNRTSGGLTPHPRKSRANNLVSLLVAKAAAHGGEAAPWRQQNHGADSHDLQPTPTLQQPQLEQQQQEEPKQQQQHLEEMEVALPVNLGPGIGLGSRARTRQAGRRRAQLLEEPPGQLLALVAPESPGPSIAGMVQDSELAAAAVPVATVQGVEGEQQHGAPPMVVTVEGAEGEQMERCGDADVNACEDAGALAPATVAGNPVSGLIGQAPAMLGSPSQPPCAEDEDAGASAPAAEDAPNNVTAPPASEDAAALGNPSAPSDEAIIDDATLAALMAGGTMYDIVKLRGRQSQIGAVPTPGDKLTPPSLQPGSKGTAPSVSGRCGSAPTSVTKSGVSGAKGSSVMIDRDNKASNQHMAASGGTGVRAGGSHASAAAVVVAVAVPTATTPMKTRATTPMGARTASTATKMSRGLQTRGAAAIAGTPRRVRADASFSRLRPVSHQKCQLQQRLPATQEQQKKRRADEGPAEYDGVEASVATAIGTGVAPNGMAVMFSATAAAAANEYHPCSQLPLSKRRRRAEVLPQGPGSGDEIDETCAVVEQTGEGVAAAEPLLAAEGTDGGPWRRVEKTEEDNLADEIMDGAELKHGAEAAIQHTDEASAWGASQPVSGDAGAGEEAVPEELPGSPRANSSGHTYLSPGNKQEQQHQGQQHAHDQATTSGKKDDDDGSGGGVGATGCGSFGAGKGDPKLGGKADRAGANTRACRKPNTRSHWRQPHEDMAAALTVAAVAANTTGSGAGTGLEHAEDQVAEQGPAAAVEGGDEELGSGQVPPVRRSGRLRQGKSTEAAPGEATQSHSRPLAQSVGIASMAAVAPVSSVSTRGAARRQALAAAAALAGDNTPCTKRPAQRSVATRGNADEDSEEVGAQGGSRPAKRTRQR
ncbi:hypothetical protein Vretifemale_3550 [Volvox reticuliferus]|nr:hypothetical protein Vretifemale_3550 [Volvox reticuliferus]